MHIVGFYVAKKRPPLKRWQKITIAIAIAGGFYAVLFLCVPSAFAQPDWGSLGKTWGKALGENYWDSYQKAHAVRAGSSQEIWDKQWFHPAAEYARSCIIAAKESGRLTEHQMKALHRILDEIMKEQTAKTYNDDWHRVFAKLKGGKISRKLSTLDMINIGDYVTDPEGFDWGRWRMPGSGNYKVPPKMGLFESFKRLFDIRKSMPLDLPGAEDGLVGLPGAQGGSPIIAPGIEQGMISLPGEALGPAAVPGVNQGFAYLHGQPSQLDQMLSSFDGNPYAFTPDWFPVWIIPILIILARAAGIPL